MGSYAGARAMAASMIAKHIALAESRKLLLVGCYTSAAYDETPSQFRDPDTPTGKSQCILWESAAGGGGLQHFFASMLY